MQALPPRCLASSRHNAVRMGVGVGIHTPSVTGIQYISQRTPFDYSAKYGSNDHHYHSHLHCHHRPPPPQYHHYQHTHQHTHSMHQHHRRLFSSDQQPWKDDPWLSKARKLGYPSRAVFKLEEIDKKHRLFRQGMRVLDLGCCPGSWTMYASKKVRGMKKKKRRSNIKHNNNNNKSITSKSNNNVINGNDRGVLNDRSTPSLATHRQPPVNEKNAGVDWRGRGGGSSNENPGFVLGIDLQKVPVLNPAPRNVQILQQDIFAWDMGRDRNPSTDADTGTHAQKKEAGDEKKGQGNKNGVDCTAEEEDTQSQTRTKYAKFDVVLSDMAPPTTGNQDRDSQGSLELCHEVLRVASRVMKKKGTVVMKIFQGRGTEEFIKSLRKPTAHASNAATAHTHTDADAHATDGLSARTSEGGRGGKQRSKRGDRGIRKQVPNEKKYKKVKANLDHLDDDDDDEEDDDEEEDDGDNHADDSSSGTKLSTRAVKGERGRSTRGEGEGEGCVHGAGGAYRHGVPVLPLQFDMVKVVKPKASRKRSVEVFIVARNH